jgi:hypothetical protein
MIYLILVAFPLEFFALFWLLGVPVVESVVGAVFLSVIFISLGLWRLGIADEEFEDDDQMSLGEVRLRTWGIGYYQPDASPEVVPPPPR